MTTGERWRQISDAHRGILFAAQAVAFALLGVLIAAWLWRTPATADGAGEGGGPSTVGAAAETLWTCSMHPQIRATKPGDCPICGMDLIPVVKTEGGMRTLALSPESKALMRIATLPVERQFVGHEIRMVGRVDYDETRLGYITAWVSGRLDRLYVDYTGVEVKQGDHLAYIYSEQLYSAQEELILAVRRRGERPLAEPVPPGLSRGPVIDLVESSREKLRLLGLKDEQIAEIERQDRPTDHVTIYSPVGGIVIEKLKQQGDRVQLGERIYTIADLSHLWVHLDAYESDLPWVRYGQDVTITTEAFPGEEFHGRIAFIQPVLNDKTRTVKARVNLPNASGKLKPEMFVRAVVRPRVAAGGKVMDPSLAGKWISPMHPEIVKDEPGTCDICGMPLVRAESLGYVSAGSADERPPLVIPYRAALVTGTRAIVYVQLPDMPSFAEPALATLAAVVPSAKLDDARQAFAAYAKILDRTYDRSATAFARQRWNRYADRLAKLALAGSRAKTTDDSKQALADVEATMNQVREEFAPPDRPTFEGREIVLGPRAGDYFLVRHGLNEGELVVVEGNFKIDAEIQIQAKPSMMTPEGGGGGGHDHGGGGAVAKKPGDEHAAHAAALPSGFQRDLGTLETAYEQVVAAIDQQDVGKAAAAFAEFRKMLAAIDATSLAGHPRMQWKEFSMLLGNDAAEGQDTKQLAEADRVFLLLKGHMRRMREQLGVRTDVEPPVERIAVPAAFQFDLARVWEKYVAIGNALAADDAKAANGYLPSLETAVATVNEQPLDEPARQAWRKERDNLTKIVAGLKNAADIKAFREQFAPLSQEIGVLAKMFGFGEAQPVYEVHCPMAFQNQGAIWYQDNDKVLNPYFGSTMLRCADRVDRLVVEEPAPSPPSERSPHEKHSHH